jgi:hypothetical protein
LALADTTSDCYWLDRPERPAPCPALGGREEADLVIAGGGFPGLSATRAWESSHPDLGRGWRSTCSIAPRRPHLALDFVRKRSLPWPPEPIRSIAVQLTQRGLARADANEGRRGLWLRMLDFAGLGFDS